MRWRTSFPCECRNHQLHHRETGVTIFNYGPKNYVLVRCVDKGEQVVVDRVLPELELSAVKKALDNDEGTGSICTLANATFHDWSESMHYDLAEIIDSIKSCSGEL